jgi:PAS domain S-box-containing protein
MNLPSIPQCIPEPHGQEHPLQGWEGQLCGILDHAPLATCAIGLDKCILLVNEELCRMLGYSREELSGAPWTKMTHAGDQQLLQQAFEELILQPDAYINAEIRLLHSNRSVVLTRMMISLARNKSGSPSCFAFHIEDITECKRANEALRESEERFRMIADRCPSTMWATDAEGNFQFVNKSYREYFGIANAEMPNSKTRLPIHPDDEPKFVAAFTSALTEHTPFSLEIRVQRADGEWRLLDSRAKPILSSSGEYLGHIGVAVDITERSQDEQARQFELSLIRSIQEETLEGILVVNEAGNIVSHNARFLEMWGIRRPSARDPQPDSLIGSSDHSLLVAVRESVIDPDSFMKRVQELYERPHDEDHCEIRLKDGRTLERHSKGLWDREARYQGRVWFFRDVTTYKQAEANIQEAVDLAEEAKRRLLRERSIVENERRILHALIDNIPDFMYVKDLQSRFVVANPHLAQAVGVKTPAEMLGKTDFDFYPRELASAYFEDERNAIRSGMPLYNREEKGIDAAGNVVDILTTKVPVRDGKGRVIGIAGIGRDISSRKETENALREAERNYRGIFENAIVGIFQSTPDGRFLSVNPALASIFGYDSPEEMMAIVTDIPRQCYADPKRRDEFLSSIRSVGHVNNFEGEAVRKDGSKIWVSLGVRAIKQSGVVVRLEGMCEDVTERNMLRVQLLQAQKLESVGQLAAGIAHEINTPTQYIGDNIRFLKDAFQDLKGLLASYEELLSAAKQNKLSLEEMKRIDEAVQDADPGYLLEEIPKAIDQTLEGVTRVSTLVKAMKEFSHPGAKEKVPMDLNHAIDSTITVARNEWKYVSDVETDFDLSMPPIPCLPGEINQVILNLIVNAAHAIADVVQKDSAAKGKITLQTRNCAAWAEIRIGDTGTGIPKEVRSRIFDPFFTTKEIGKGTGQGLAIARSVVVDKHGGSIDFETEEGKGTTFIIRLPFDGRTLQGKGIAA